MKSFLTRPGTPPHLALAFNVNSPLCHMLGLQKGLWATEVRAKCADLSPSSASCDLRTVGTVTRATPGRIGDAQEKPQVTAPRDRPGDRWLQVLELWAMALPAALPMPKPPVWYPLVRTNLGNKHRCEPLMWHAGGE